MKKIYSVMMNKNIYFQTNRGSNQALLILYLTASFRWGASHTTTYIYLLDSGQGNSLLSKGSLAVSLLKKKEHSGSVKCYLFKKCSAAESATKQRPEQQQKGLDSTNSMVSTSLCSCKKSHLSWPSFKNPNL